MKTTIFSILAMLMIATLFSNISGSWNEAIGDDDHGGWLRQMKGKSTHVNPAKNSLYVEECGSCHLAYSPSLLPKASWDKIMAGLGDHFGDNAELDVEIARQISGYLHRYSADTPDNGRSRKFSVKDKNQVPVRITALPYFRHEHNEIPPCIIKSKQVGSLSNCGACHSGASQGVFDEDQIYIMGIGRWND